MKSRLFVMLAAASCLLPASVMPPALAAEQALDREFHHLRIDGPREWAEFPEAPESAALDVRFSAEANAREYALRLRQQDVKQLWRVRLNDKELGRLVQDEADMVIVLPVPAGTLIAGENRLRIEQDQGPRSKPDDIRVGEITLEPRSVREALSAAAVEVTVTDEAGEPLPCRLSIADANGALHVVRTEPDDRLAVRPGVIYTADGRARFTLPAGRFTVYATRGFEYSVASQELDLQAKDSANVALSLRREVPTAGWVACDTHIHTLTHSGHGDATIEERLVTLAGEAVELPIATDHNVQIDFEPTAQRLGVLQHFTPVVGNEVTTRFGHFNIFPVDPQDPPPNRNLTEWPAIFEAIGQTGAKIVVLNHGRDVHSGFRPFDPRRFNAAAGARLDDRPIGFNAMEVLNSGATQTDVMRLFHDWMALLNTGHEVTPVGSSDSHDVTRYVVGQGRTYLRCEDSDPGKIDVNEALEALRNGRVLVSYGLLAEMTAGDAGGPGDLVPVKDREVEVAVRVLGPSWVRADRVELFMNGVKIREASIEPTTSPGEKWSGSWMIPTPTHDAHLVAIARGPGVNTPYWQTRKPYQPTSPKWTPQLIGCTGAIWIDADGDGKKTPPRRYAEELVERAGDDLNALLTSLAEFDTAVAAQAAHLYQANGGSLTSPAFRESFQASTPAVRAGFQRYFEAWRESQTAEATGPD